MTLLSERIVQLATRLRKGSERLRLDAERRIARPWLAMTGGRERVRQANVAMFHLGRSGSTVLADLLRQHRHVHWDGEIYNQHFRRLVRTQGPLKIGESDTGLDPARRFEECMHRSIRRVYGFELKFCQLALAGVDLEEYLDDVRRRGLSHWIVLERRNHLRKVVSAAIAQRTRQYHRRPWKEPTLHRVVIDVGALSIDYETRPLLEFLEGYRESFARLDRLLDGESVLRLTYEDDLAPDPLAAYRRICDFVGLEPRQPTIRYARMNPYPLSELIENYEEVERALVDTEYEWMLREEMR